MGKGFLPPVRAGRPLWSDHRNGTFPDPPDAGRTGCQCFQSGRDTAKSASRVCRPGRQPWIWTRRISRARAPVRNHSQPWAAHTWCMARVRSRTIGSMGERRGCKVALVKPSGGYGGTGVAEVQQVRIGYQGWYRPCIREVQARWIPERLQQFNRSLRICLQPEPAHDALGVPQSIDGGGCRAVLLGEERRSHLAAPLRSAERQIGRLPPVRRRCLESADDAFAATAGAGAIDAGAFCWGWASGSRASGASGNQKSRSW